MMRNPERIDKVIGLLREYWKRHPDLRLCQIIGNFANTAYGNSGTCMPMSTLTYYTEDDIFMLYLQARLAKDQ